MKQSTETASMRREMMKLIICVLILLAAFIFKHFYPAQAEKISDNISDGIDINAALTSIGTGLREVFSFSKNEDPPVSPPVSPEVGTEQPETSPADDLSLPMLKPGQLFVGDADEEDITGDEDAENESEEEPSSGPIMMDEMLLENGDAEEGAGVLIENPEEDDTLPLPFGYEVPEKADFTVYTLPFAYTIPVSGEISSGFAYRLHPVDKVIKFHYGIDIVAAKGKSVKSFAAGKVIATGTGNDYGKYVMVEHADGFVTLYAHLNKISVKTGQKIKLGDTIGKVGTTGKSTGPHLHFEIRYNGKLVNPTPYLTK